MGLAVWVEDEAGPYQAIPQPGAGWHPAGQPARMPHEYIRGGPAKLLTLFHPASGHVRVQGVTSGTNAVLHPWMQQTLTEVLGQLPVAPVMPPTDNRWIWNRWQDGLTVKFTLPATLPPLRLLLVLDNLRGHKTPELVCWLVQQGVMPLLHPRGRELVEYAGRPHTGAVLPKTAESIQRILVRRALSGHHPSSATQIIEWLEATATGWNRAPTPFVWGGKRRARRQRARARQHRLGGSGACTHQVVR